MKQTAPILLLLVLGMAMPLPAAAEDYAETYPAEPIKLNLDLAATWDQVLAVLEKMGYEVDSQDRANGQILTKAEESISGAYAGSELRKVAVVVADYQASLRKGKHFLEITVSFLKPTLTSVAATAHISALKRSYDGQEEWITLKSNGALEVRFLNELNIAVTGKRIYDKKIPTWRKPIEIPIQK